MRGGGRPYHYLGGKFFENAAKAPFSSFFVRFFLKKWLKNVIKPISATGFQNFRKSFQLCFEKKFEKISLLNRPEDGLKHILRESKVFRRGGVGLINFENGGRGYMGRKTLLRGVNLVL